MTTQARQRQFEKEWAARPWHSVACHTGSEADAARIIARQRGVCFQAVNLAHQEHTLILVDCPSTARVVRTWIRKERKLNR